MVYCSQKIASLSHCRVQKLSFKHTSYIPSFLIPTPTFHHIGVGVLRIRTRHLETHCYLLPLNAFITYDILIYINLYITYIRYIFIQLGPLTHSLCSIPFYHPRKSVLAKVHLSILCAPTATYLRSQHFSLSLVPENPQIRLFQILSTKRRTFALSKAWYPAGRRGQYTDQAHQIPPSQNPVYQMLQDVLSWARRSWWPSHGSRFGQYDLKHMGISIPPGCNPATLEITAISLECDPTLRSSPQLTQPWHQLSWWPIRWT